MKHLEHNKLSTAANSNVKVIVTSSSFRDAQRGIDRLLLTRCPASLLNMTFLIIFLALSHSREAAGRHPRPIDRHSRAVQEHALENGRRGWIVEKKEINITGSLFYRNMLQVSYGLWSVSPSLSFWVRRINGTDATNLAIAVVWWVANGHHKSGSSAVLAADPLASRRAELHSCRSVCGTRSGNGIASILWRTSVLISAYDIKITNVDHEDYFTLK